ncbi:MAG: hypothetical protein JJU33_02130 [Phycisphaerales bacterium]|nr:hypothetical protein [Phycisphaerales bacterium]
MPIPSIQKLLAAPAPGLVFEVDDIDGDAQIARQTPHLLGGPASPAELRTLRQLTGGDPAHATLEKVYERHNGLQLYLMWDGTNGLPFAAVHLLPISMWAVSSMEYKSEEEMESLSAFPMYASGSWRIIGLFASGKTVLVYFFNGERDGESVAGEVFTLSLDPILGADEELAESFEALLDAVAEDPADLIGKISLVWQLNDKGDDLIGDVISHAEDITTHPGFSDWTG